MGLDSDLDFEERNKAVLNAALDAVQDTPKLRVSHRRNFLELVQQDSRFDNEIVFEVRGEEVTYLIEVIPTLHKAKLNLLLDRFRFVPLNFGRRPMIVTGRMSNEHAEWCRENEIAFIDAAGNMFISTDHFETFICGLKLAAGLQNLISPSASGGTTAFLKATFPLLCDRELINAPYREIARLTGISVGTVKNVFDVLKSRNMIGERYNGRVWIEPARLFEEWVVGYAAKLRPKMKPKRYTTDSDALWRVEPNLPEGMMWGGEAAAERIAPVLLAGIGALCFDPDYAKDSMRRFMHEHRFRSDPDGNVEVLESFWPHQEHFTSSFSRQQGTTPHVVTYAELMASSSSRNREAAQYILENYIDRTFHSR
ncbi:type IV toxin-antitoxin system AbiEi family antitoxin [Silvimonas soli]|uniref:type IV toxin-antitoxin system AbiEi family antitoxin n=1 Tax=Silvimonas soli TaxID=2980100 RepID=UPI0024B37068|nr:type IV toxin-antitoxin system AbiEi family antitoxin [Silvimonas soli]